MSPIYFNVLSEYLEATLVSKVDFKSEDVHILKDLANLFAVSLIEIEVRSNQGKPFDGAKNRNQSINSLSGRQDIAPPVLSIEACTIKGLLLVKQLPEILQQSLRYSSNTDFAESLQRNVQEFGMAF